MSAEGNFLIQVLALSNSSGVGEFLRQISGLVVITCGAGLVWLALMMLVMQRAAERRRRTARGLEPLPGLHTSIMRWLTHLMAPDATPPPAPATPQKPQPPDETLPAPDLTLLTADLPAPDLSDLVGDESPPPEPEADTPAEVEVPVEPAPDELDHEPEEPETTPIPEPQAEEETPDMPIPPPEPAPAPQDSVELLRVYRDLADGTLIVEIGGQQFRSLGELRGADLERRFQNVLRDLDILARPVRRTAAPPPTTSHDTVEEDALKPRAGTMLRQMTRLAMGQTPEPVEEEPELSIADQIEALLQARLEHLPEFSGRDIHVKPALDGGVRIEVDGTAYSGVGEIAEDDVRELLVDVVREWEESQ